MLILPMMFAFHWKMLEQMKYKFKTQNFLIFNFKYRHSQYKAQWKLSFSFFTGYDCNKNDQSQFRNPNFMRFRLKSKCIPWHWNDTKLQKRALAWTVFKMLPGVWHIGLIFFGHLSLNSYWSCTDTIIYSLMNGFILDILWFYMIIIRRMAIYFPWFATCYI